MHVGIIHCSDGELAWPLTWHEDEEGTISEYHKTYIMPWALCHVDLGITLLMSHHLRVSCTLPLLNYTSIH